MNRLEDIFNRNLRSNPSLIDFDFEIEIQRSNMSIFTQSYVAVDNMNLVLGKRIGWRADSKVDRRLVL